jgi:nicotinate dehydrogenase subunit A
MNPRDHGKTPMTVRIALTINGQDQSLDVDPDTPLLYILRNDVRLNGPKFGCGAGQCGACTVIMNGRAIRSCVMPMAAAANARITTLEGLGTAEDLTRSSRRSSMSRRPSAATAPTA